MTPFIRLRRCLRGPVDPPVWPRGFGPVAFGPDRMAGLHALLAEAYADGGGAVGPRSEWAPALLADAEFDPALVFLAADDRGAVSGAVQAWTSGFVKDVAVARTARRRGLGAALLLTAFAEFRRRGLAAVDLKVRPGNAAALAFYGALDMAPAQDPP
jgi:ribosomal protein S18 acetylase RimI-like enzyme